MLQVKNLTYSYPKTGMTVFSDFSLTVEAGKVYGLLGRNGAGKSTLMYLMMGVLRPKAGVVEYKGVAMHERRPSALSDIFIVPEELELPAISLKNFVEINAPFYPKFSISDMQDYLKLFDMENFDANLQRLSMGQKKKVYMSFALATNTSILLMDEPTNGLDIPSKRQFRKIIARGMSADRTIVLSTHQVRDVESVVDQVLILDGSRVMLNASVAEIGKRLAFKVVDDVAGAIYWQQSMLGNAAVVPNSGGEETMVDFEMLFNATISSPQRIAALFDGNE